MKIVQTPVRFYPFVGGVEKYVLDLSQELCKKGHKVEILCANEPRRNKNEIYNKIKIKRLNYCGKIANTNLMWGLPLELIKSKFDIMHTHIPTPWSADWSAWISFIKKKPLIVTYHNDLNESTDNFFINIITKIYNATFLKIILNIANKIIITQPKYIEYSPIIKKYKQKTTVIPNAIDINKFKKINTIKKNENSLFFLSVLDKYHKYKGLDVLLHSLKLIKKKIPNIKLVVGGSGELIPEYKKIVKNLGLENNVAFEGYIPDEKLIDYFNQSNLFVLPSIAHQEGFGIVLLEAMACGTPVVSTNIVGVATEIINNNTGLIVKPKNVNELSSAIIKILNNSQLSKEMGQNGINLVRKKYCWEKIVDDMIETYK